MLIFMGLVTLSLTSFNLILLCSFAEAVNETSSATEAIQALACHSELRSENLANDGTLENIDIALDMLYDKIETTEEILHECDYSIDIDGDEIGLVHQFERFEVQRSSYVHGTWGYCAKEGAASLLGNMKKLDNALKNRTSGGKPVMMCDRSKLLNCHPAYKRCQCIVDNKDFQNVASDYWNDAEVGKLDPKRMLGQSQCVLMVGSDCSLPSESPFLCVPGTNCLFKHDMSPCIPEHMEGVVQSMSRTKRQADANTTAPSKNGHRKSFSFSIDSFPTIHCECVGFERKEGGFGTKNLAGTIVINYSMLLCSLISFAII